MPSKSRGRARKQPTSQPGTNTVPSSEFFPNGASLAPSRLEMLRKLYAGLVRCRILAEHIRRLPASDEIANPYELAAGCEVAIVGTTAELDGEDTIAAPPRNLAALIARGAPAAALLSSNANGWAAPAVPGDPFNAGVGIALTHKLEQKRRAVVAICSERAPALDAWKDAFSAAATQKLPVIFVVENDIAVESSGNGAAHHLDALSFAVRDTRMPGIVVDGSDVVAIWRVAQEAIHRARNGWGPTLIDCRTDPARDPLTHLENYLRKHRAWDDTWHRQLEGEIRNEIKHAVAVNRHR